MVSGKVLTFSVVLLYQSTLLRKYILFPETAYRSSGLESKPPIFVKILLQFSAVPEKGYKVNRLSADDLFLHL